jgi:hypothetical protein
MFDLDQSIAAWRRQMRSAGIRTEADLDELESHLLEDMARRRSAGMEPREAFEAAARQVGSAKAVQAEFAKLNWPTAGQLRKWGIVGYSAELAAYSALQICQFRKAEPSHQDLVFGMIGLAATLGAAYAVWQLAPKVMGRVGSRAIRSSMVVAGCVSALVWLLVFARCVLPQLTLTPGQFAVVFLWAMLPLVVAPALASGLAPRASA